LQAEVAKCIVAAARRDELGHRRGSSEKNWQRKELVETRDKKWPRHDLTQRRKAAARSFIIETRCGSNKNTSKESSVKRQL